MSAVAKVLEISLGIQIFNNPKLGHSITFMCRKGDKRKKFEPSMQETKQSH